VALDPTLVSLLVCPEDRQPLAYLDDEQTLYNPRTRRRYRIDDGIPVLLVDDSQVVDEAEAARLQARIDGGEAVLTGAG
jgi:uncharacterized protein YbaR (Trm112 family)